MESFSATIDDRLVQAVAGVEARLSSAETEAEQAAAQRGATDGVLASLQAKCSRVEEQIAALEASHEQQAASQGTLAPLQDEVTQLTATLASVTGGAAEAEGRLSERMAALESGLSEQMASLEAQAHEGASGESLGSLKAEVAGLSEHLTSLEKALIDLGTRLDAAESGVAQGPTTSDTEMSGRLELLSAHLEAVTTRLGVAEERLRSHGGNSLGSAAATEESERLAAKIKELEARQSKVTTHIVDLSTKISSSTADARAHEDALKRHIQDTVSPMWETMNMLSRRIDCIM